MALLRVSRACKPATTRNLDYFYESRNLDALIHNMVHLHRTLVIVARFATANLRCSRTDLRATVPWR